MTHVYPLNDLKAHETEAIDCACKPRIDWNEHIVVHNSYDGRESRERQVNALQRLGVDILGEISAVQCLLELPAAHETSARPSLLKAWGMISKHYADGRFKNARAMFGSLRSLASAVLADVEHEDRDKFLDEAFGLGYVGWVNCMDERLEGCS